MPIWSRIRAEFSSLSQWTFLDTASFGQLPRNASDAIIKHLAHRTETASTRFLSWFDDMDRIRQLVATLIGCSSEDIAFVPNASTGLALLMHGIEWKAGDEVLTLSDEFPNQLYLSASALRFGTSFRKVRWSELYASITGRTRLVALSTVNYATGFRPPLAELGRFLKERGVLLYLDGTQSVGALQIDVQSVCPAMLCVDAYKWLVSPNGAGFVYVDPQLRATLPATTVGWRSDAGWRQVNQLNHETPVFLESAQKYEPGMLPFPSLYAMGAVIEMMLEIGPAAIEARVLELASGIRSMLVSLGATVNQDPSQIVTATLPGHDSGEVVKRLKARDIIISARHGKLRISPHFYNNESDIETLASALR